MTVRLRSTGYLLVVITMPLLGCGGPSPSGPTPPVPTAGSVTTVALSGTVPAIGASSSFTAIATLSSGATQNITSQATWQSSNLAVITVASTGVVTGTGVGEADVRATYQGISGSQHVSLVGPTLTGFQKDYIEAVFLGTGRLTPSDGNHGCSATGYMRGFSRGTTVSVIVSSTVSADKLAAIRLVSDQVFEATAGLIQTRLTLTPDPEPRPALNEVTSTTHPSAASQGCASDDGCTIHVFVNPSAPGVYLSSRALQPASQTPAAYAHDVIGHGVVGLCHPDGNLIGGARLSLMSAGPNVFSGGPSGIADRLTTFDLAAARAVYEAGLSAGARRADFLRVGVINP